MLIASLTLTVAAVLVPNRFTSPTQVKYTGSIWTAEPHHHAICSLAFWHGSKEDSRDENSGVQHRSKQLKAFVVLLFILLTSCGGSSSNDPANDDPNTTGNTGQGDTGGYTAGDTGGTARAERFPAVIGSTISPALMTEYEPMVVNPLPDNQRYLDDINGDGLKEIAIYVDMKRGQSYSAVVFGTQSGDLPEIQQLDGSNGFVLDNLRQPLSTIGDINGDGRAEISFYNSGWFEVPQWRVLAGASSYPARRSSLDVTEDELLIHLALLTDAKVAGDINGDNIDDLILGATSGVAPRIIYGLENLKLTNTRVIPDGGILDYCDSGFCDANPVGDFDGDGYDDMLISRFSCRYSNYRAILYGGPDGIEPRDFLDDYPTNDITRIVSETASECLEATYSGLSGDIDADGNNDLLFAAASAAYPAAPGRLIFGKSNPRATIISIDELDGAKGMMVQLQDNMKITDINDDGYDDIAYADGNMFTGRNRDIDSEHKPVVRRGDNVMRLYWSPSTNPDTSKYQVSINSSVSEFDAAETSTVVTGEWGDDALTVVLESLDKNNNVLERSSRIAPPYIRLENISATLLAPRQIEITFNSSARIKRYGQYLVWRDGVPIGRSISGADNYVDSDLELGTTYTYFITPDYLRNGTVEADNLNAMPLLQRQSNVVSIVTE